MGNTVKMPSLDRIQRHYAESGSKARTNYTESIDQMPDVKAASVSDSAERNYADGVTEAVANKTRVKGLERVTDSEIKARMRDVGAAAIAQKIAQSGGKMAKGYSETRAALDGLSLPDRTRDPLTNLTERAGAVVKAATNARRRRLGLPEI